MEKAFGNKKRRTRLPLHNQIIQFKWLLSSTPLSKNELFANFPFLK